MMSKQFYKEELGKMIAENSNLKRKIQELELQIKFGTPTDGLEVGSPEDYGEQPWIYESPDGGKTVYKRRAGDRQRELFDDSKQLNLFDEI